MTTPCAETRRLLQLTGSALASRPPHPECLTDLADMFRREAARWAHDDRSPRIAELLLHLAAALAETGGSARLWQRCRTRGARKLLADDHSFAVDLVARCWAAVDTWERTEARGGLAFDFSEAERLLEDRADA